MIKAVVVGYGNIGKYVIETIKNSDDFELCGLVRRAVPTEIPNALCGVEIVDNVDTLTVKPDVAILCVPTRSTEETAKDYLKRGINTVDSFDIHGQIYDLKKALDVVAKEHNAVSVVSAGWDPGSDSVVRALMLSCAPQGITFTNFGVGMSMGHTVAVKAIEGVAAALSVTVPLGTGVHRRMVYIELEPGYELNDVAARIKADDYFAKDDTHVTAVNDVSALLDMGHGVNMTRKGVSGATQNQLFEFNMKINNPALTAQNLVNVARASTKQVPGAYTMIEIPVIDLLDGDKESLIRALV